MLTNPVEVLGTDDGWVRGMRCVEMELGEPDASGRRSPVVKPGKRTFNREFSLGYIRLSPWRPCGLHPWQG